MVESNHFLYLNDNCIRFQAVPDPRESETSVFYDEGNGQIFVVNKRTNVVTVKGPNAGYEMTFTIANAREIHSIAFSPCCSILAVHKLNIVTFCNFTNNLPGKEYSYALSKSGCKILGIRWTCVNEIIIITDSSIELCKIDQVRMLIIKSRSIAFKITWFVFNHQSNFLLVPICSDSTLMQSFQFAPGSIFKLSKFKIDLRSSRAEDRSKGDYCLAERDVYLTTLYGKLRLLVFRQCNLTSARSTASSSSSSSSQVTTYNYGAQIAIYSFEKDKSPDVTHVLELELTGRFAISIIDNLIIFHHQTSQASLIFDIRSKTSSMHGKIPHFRTLIPPLSIRPPATCLPDVQSIEMYSNKWAVFLPNVIIDASIGCLWYLEVDLSVICKIMTQSAPLVDFLISRRNSKQLMIEITRETLLGERWSSNGRILGTISELFTKLNQACNANQVNRIDCTASRSTTSLRDCVQEITLMTLDQKDMCDSVFNILFSQHHHSIPSEFGVSVLLEYIHLLNLHGIRVEYSTYRCLLQYLIDRKMTHHLQQYLQFHVFEDSKELATLLLSNRPHVTNAVQLAFDMLKRLNTPAEEMIDVILSLKSPNSVLRALRYASTPQQSFDSISARKFLQVSKDTSDEIFFNTFHLFEQRNLRTRGSIHFSPGELCDDLVQYYHNQFHTSETTCSGPADTRDTHDDTITVPPLESSERST